MSKPTIDDVIFAAYVVSMNLNSQCPYCNLSLTGANPEVKMRHFETDHTDDVESQKEGE